MCSRTSDAPTTRCSPSAPAVADATEVGDPGLLAEALAVTASFGSSAGTASTGPRWHDRWQLEDPDRRTFFQSRPSLIAAILLFWTGNLEQAQRALDGVIASVR